MRSLLALLIFAAPAAAQFQLFVVDTLSERPVGAVQDLGTVTRGDALSTRFRLRNTSASAATVRSLEVAGSGYALESSPALPQTVNAGAALDFTVAFRATTEGVYSAVLRSEGISVFLTATVIAQLTLSQVTSLGAQPLASGATIAFGSVERGLSTTVRLLFQNQTAIDQVTPPVQVTGSEFSAPASTAGRVLHPQEEFAFDVTFSPTVNGLRSATMTVGARTFTLQGTGLEPPLPRPQVSVTLARPQSGQQGQVAVLLPDKARTSGSGALTLTFTPASAGATDPAIQFAGGSRTANFSFAAGDDRAVFAGQAAVPFQTGTTAGTLTFTARLGGVTSEQSVTLASATVSMTSVATVRAAGSVEVRVTAYDNTRTSGPLTFTFYDKVGAAISPGAIKVDSTADFTRYFQSSDLGGTFLLRATFPVTGDATGIDAVEVEMTNSAGATKSDRTKLP